ncbi:MAG: DUF1573 domain-containing protein [Crocinitomicaceae bacterium]
MKRILILILIVVGQFSFAQILVSEPSQDLGDVYENRGEVAAEFILSNPYLYDTIRIHDIITSCGCTAILSQDTLILPQSSIPLKFSYNPKGRSGLFTKSIEVVSRIGVYDQHRLFLKLTGNVVNENPAVKVVDGKLVEYLVAPINYFAITPYDTSYLDFNFFISFVNDLSYEVDFYQFTTIGFEIGVRNHERIEALENLIRFSRRKLNHEFELRGYNTNTVFFDDPIFKIEELPTWATASIKVYSVNFGSDLLDESIIKVSKENLIENTDMLLNYSRFSKPTAEEVIEKINFDRLEAKLWMNGNLDLQGVILSPSRMSYNDREKLANSIEKLVFKHMKKSSGVTKKNVTVHFDSLAYHPEEKYRFMMWHKGDEEAQQSFTYEVKPDHIQPPFLPTYKQSTLTSNLLDENSSEFQLFWKNLILNQKAGHEIKLLVFSSKSTIPVEGADNLYTLALSKGKAIQKQLQKKFLDETGRTLTIQVEADIQGPEYNWKLKRDVDYDQYEYINIIPLVHHKKGVNEQIIKPYMVNFDYFFNGIDTSSWAFSRFAAYLKEEVNQNGYVKLILESSISKIPIDSELSNDYLVYKRALESQQRIRAYLSSQLIDPNRVIFIEERFLVQGPEYNKKIPIVKYRDFQYLKIVPEKFIKQ